MKPQQLTENLERNITLPEGSEERFNGYGVMGVTFQSGHILALRRFPATSIGPGYTSVWYRNPAREWTFYSDAEPGKSCSRFFGSDVQQVSVQPIHITWASPNSFSVRIQDADFSWHVKAGASAASRVLNFISSLLPDRLWKNKLFLHLLEKAAGKLLGAGKIGLTGMVPNSQHFIANPRTLFMIKETHASLNGEDFGKTGPLPEQAHLRDFWIPQKGILALGQVYFDVFDPAKHSAATTAA